MSDISAVIRGSEKTVRYLDNATDSAARQEILAEARKSGLADPALSLITHKTVYHTGESLSPVAGMAIGKNGRLVVSDEFNHRLIVYDDSGKQLQEIGKQGSGEMEFHYPRGLCFDDDGNLYVTDAWNHRIVVLAPDLSFKSTIGKLGTGDGELDEPVGVVWSSGRLAVLEKSNHRVQLFSGKGASMGTIAMGSIGTRGSVAEQEQFYLLKTRPEEFCTPVFEFPTAIAADSGDNLYVADTNNHRIVKLNFTGQEDSSYAISGLRHPTGLSVDKNDNLHVTQFNRGDVRVFSPEGILLYGYTVSGIELPVAITVNASSVYVGGGMKASVSVNGFDADHDATLARENDFSFYFKKAMAQFRAGNFDEAVKHLKLASELSAEKRLSPAEFAAGLPEIDYSFLPGGNPKAAKDADGFIKILDVFCDSIWETVSTLFEAKLAAVDGYADAVLLLEKSLLAGTGDEDTFMVERMRAVRKVLNLSSEMKHAFTGYKKLQEFLRRLALCGIGLGARPERIGVNMVRINEWKKSREQWYEAAEQAAPALTFNSGPDERESFALNQNRLEMFDFEFRLLWEFAGEFNRETASLIRASGWKSSPLFGEFIFNAVDFYFVCSDNFYSRLEYYRSLEDLFDAAGSGNLSNMLSGATPRKYAGQAGVNASALWEALGREDNIPYKSKPEVYRLFPALWSATGLECGTKPDVTAWEKIVDFYHAELERYIGENKPLRTEFIRTGGMLAAAERGDPKQAMLVRRKLSLLWFHNYYQERYISGILMEYQVRFAFFALNKNPIGKELISSTEKKLDEIFKSFRSAQINAVEEAAALEAKIEDAANWTEKNRLTHDLELQQMFFAFSIFVNAHLTTAIQLTRDKSSGYLALRRRIGGGGAALRKLEKPGFMVFDKKGNLYVVSVTQGTVNLFNGNGGFQKTFAGFGSVPGRLSRPVGVAITPDGDIAVSQYMNPSLSLFSPDGRFIRRFVLEKEDGRQPRFIQFDEAGRLFVSFTDGRGLSIFDLQGRLVEKIETGDTPLDKTDKIYGFYLSGGDLFLGGRQKLYHCSLKGELVRSISCGATGLDHTSSLAVDKKGNLYALGYHQNLLLRVDPEFKNVEIMSNIPAQFASTMAVNDKTMALGDMDSDAVWLLDL